MYWLIIRTYKIHRMVNNSVRISKIFSCLDAAHLSRITRVLGRILDKLFQASWCITFFHVEQNFFAPSIKNQKNRWELSKPQRLSFILNEKDIVSIFFQSAQHFRVVFIGAIHNSSKSFIYRILYFYYFFILEISVLNFIQLPKNILEELRFVILV